MKKVILFGLIVSLFIGLFLPCRVSAQTRVAKIIFMDGEVQVQRGGGGNWTDAEKGMVLAAGDKLKTGDDSWSEVSIGEGHQNVVRVQQQTLTEVKDLGPVRIYLLKGELRTLLEELNPDETFEIVTPTAVCGTRGTGWDTITDGVKTVVDVYEASIFFGKLSDEGELMAGPIIKTGKRGVLEDRVRPIKIKNIPAGRKRSWNKWKKDFSQRRAVETGKSGDSDEGDGGNGGDDGEGSDGKGELAEKVKVTNKQQKSIESIKESKTNVSDRLDEGDIDNRTKDNSDGGGQY
ncbi:MAG: FecR domain-containing protein [Candidatus Omnitrophica bacterium]|nr:FecR domain-containing protein [Candidatus Omnitrophota bacterium]